LLTLEEVLRVAADRGRRLEVVIIQGRPYLSDGFSRPLPCPTIVRSSLLPRSFIYGFCRHFGFAPIDFSLDPDPDD
jgi:hypothetical protein